MDVKETRKYLLSKNLICDLYRSRVANAGSKSALMDVMSDANGIEFVTDRISRDVQLDYPSVRRYLGNHVNGNHIFEHTEDGETYSSEIYCDYRGGVDARTTMLALWGCDVDVHVPENKLMEISCDRYSRCRIDCSRGARVICVYWGEKPQLVSLDGSVKFINKNDDV